MKNTISRQLAACTLAACLPCHAYALFSESDLSAFALLDLQAAYSDATTSWLEGGLNKTRYNEAEKGLHLGLAGLDLTYRASTQWILKGTVLADDAFDDLRVTEAFAQFRPIPRSAWKGQWRAGLFYPALSLENRGPLWTSPYTLSASAINSWIGEELRTLGLETAWTRQGRFAGSALDFTVFGSLYWGNDPAGSLLSWRGWALHDLQAGTGTKVPLPELTVFNYNGTFSAQRPYSQPIKEVDDRPGFYTGLRWRHRQGSQLGYAYYDNRADPSQIRDGQYAWHTRFHLLSLEGRLPGQLTLLAQYLIGDTLMANPQGEPKVVNDFWASYLMLSHRVDRWRSSIRLDRFRVKDLDTTADDNNWEDGRALTVALSYRITREWKAAIEYLVVDAERPARKQINEPVRQYNRQLLLSLRYGVSLK